MSDDRLRGLERAVAAGEPGARAQLLRERLRVGVLELDGLRLAAYCGDQDALAALGGDPGPTRTSALDGLSRMTALRALFLITASLLDRIEERTRSAMKPQRAAVAAFLACPCNGHRDAAVGEGGAFRHYLSPWRSIGLLCDIADVAGEWEDAASACLSSLLSEPEGLEASVRAKRLLAEWALGEGDAVALEVEPLPVSPEVRPRMLVGRWESADTGKSVLVPMNPGMGRPYGVVPAIMPDGRAIPIRRGYAEMMLRP